MEVMATETTVPLETCIQESVFKIVKLAEYLEQEIEKRNKFIMLFREKGGSIYDLSAILALDPSAVFKNLQDRQFNYKPVKRDSVIETLLPEIIKLVDLKLTAPEICEKLSISRPSLQRIFKKYKLKTERKKIEGKLTQEEKQKIDSYVKENPGVSYSTVSKDLGLDYQLTRLYLKRNEEL